MLTDNDDHCSRILMPKRLPQVRIHRLEDIEIDVICVLRLALTPNRVLHKIGMKRA